MTLFPLSVDVNARIHWTKLAQCHFRDQPQSKPDFQVARAHSVQHELRIRLGTAVLTNL